MQVKGPITSDMVTVLRAMLVADGRLKRQFCDVKPKTARPALRQLYSDLTAVTSGIINHLELENASSQVVAVLLRTLMEASISVFAFCRDPAGRADLYRHFLAVLEWKFVLLQETHKGCPWVPDDAANLATIARRKRSARSKITCHGANYVKPKKTLDSSEALECALENEATSWKQFREKWYPEHRRKILADEGMGWAYDVLYVRLCSAVHSDPAASRILGTVSREGLIASALQWWGAAVYRIVETFRLRLSAEHKGVIRMDYNSLQG